MRDAATAVAEYVPSGSDGREPELLALSVRERLHLLDTGAVPDAEWCATANAWSFAADGRYRATVDLRPLVPGSPPVRLGVKDTVDVAGFPTRLGLRRYRHHPAHSAAVLRRLSGVTVNAKVVSTELNIGLGSGCLNPYFPHIGPAGSSTGSAVAVAAGICDLSLGTDVLGSVRWPAGRCGVVGLRMTHDEGDLDGVFPLCPPMDAPGWVARTADDLAYLWERVGLGRPAAPVKRRVGVVEEVYDGAEAEILDALGTGAAALANAGHTVERVRLGELWDWRGPAWELCAREAWDGYRHWQDWIADELLPSTVAALEAGARVDDRRHAAIQDAMRRLRADVPQRFADHGVDAWLLPLDPDVPQPLAGTAAPASTIPAAGAADYDREVGYTPVASFAGLPALTFPVGVSPSSGAPLALQLVGPPHAEAALIALARDAAAGLLPRPTAPLPAGLRRAAAGRPTVPDR